MEKILLVLPICDTHMQGDTSFQGAIFRILPDNCSGALQRTLENAKGYLTSSC